VNYFHSCTFDLMTELLYGESAELDFEEYKDLMDDMSVAADGGQARWVLASLAGLVENSTFSDSVARVRKFMARYVDEAISYRKYLDTLTSSPKLDMENDSQISEEKDRMLYLHTMAKKTSDRKALLDELTTVLFAGRDTTASLLTNLFFVLAGNPRVYAKLRDEISVLGGQKPTFDELKAFPFLQSCLNECK